MTQVSIQKSAILDFYGQPAAPANPPDGQARMFYRSDNNTFHVIDDDGVDLLGGGPGGTTGQIQFNNAGVLGGIAEGTAGQVLTSNGIGVAPSFQTTAGSTQVPVVLSGGSDAIPAHTSATYMVTTAGVDAMTIAAPTVTTDDGLLIKVVTNTNAAHTITFTGGTLRPGTAAVTTVNFLSFRGSSITIMAWQGNWYVMAANVASYT